MKYQFENLKNEDSIQIKPCLPAGRNLKLKIILILPAYNAAKTLLPFLKTVPKNVFDETILVDDCSTDGTYELAKTIPGIPAMPAGWHVYKTQRNLGYGGNLKYCLSLALKKGADVIVELHPDGEYASNGILPAQEEVKKGAQLVLGNRFSEKKYEVPSGMLVPKYVVTRLLTLLDNIILGTAIPDMHQGFRVYTRRLLEAVNFRANSNHYLFSFEIILQAAYIQHMDNERHPELLPAGRQGDSGSHGIPKRVRNDIIVSVPVTASYTGKKRGASLWHSLSYALGTFGVLGRLGVARLGFPGRLFTQAPVHVPVCPVCREAYLVREIRGIGEVVSKVFFCDSCLIGFTYPQTKDIEKYYPHTYWKSEGVLGRGKDIVFRFFQTRRARLIQEYLKKGKILDVGSGEGEFGKQLERHSGLSRIYEKNTFHVSSLEVPGAAVANSDVIKADFLRFRPKKKFDAITFWESLEHVPDAKAYIEKARSLLRTEGGVFIEYPRFDSLERKLFGRYWFHLDVPRHTFHFTDKGLTMLLERVGFTIIEKKQVFAFEYAVWGLLGSVLRAFGVNETRIRKNMLLIILLLPLFALAFVIELFLYLLGQGPIGMVVAKKEQMKMSSRA